jgi:hypothetical protein
MLSIPVASSHVPVRDTAAPTPENTAVPNTARMVAGVIAEGPNAATGKARETRISKVPITPPLPAKVPMNVVDCVVVAVGVEFVGLVGIGLSFRPPHATVAASAGATHNTPTKRRLSRAEIELRIPRISAPLATPAIPLGKTA